MLKADLHLHTKNDPMEHPSWMDYDAKELINFMAKKGFKIISITHHNELLYNKSLEKYARKKGIILIPGIEFRLEGKDILVYDVTENDIKDIKKIRDLYKLKKKGKLIIAPHPYHPWHSSLGRKNLLKYIDLFDGIEYNHLHLKWYNLNKKSLKIAKKYKKFMIGNSDAHIFAQIGHTYTLINAKPVKDDIIKAIKKGKIKVVTKPLRLIILIKILLWVMKTIILRRVYQVNKLINF